MTKNYNFQTAMLSLFIKGMGGGFPDELCEWLNGDDSPELTSGVLHRFPTKGLTQNNFKQKCRKMRSGDQRAYLEIRAYLDTFMNIGPYRHSDKYHAICWDLFAKFESGVADSFYYEPFEDALSYILAKKLCRNGGQTQETGGEENPAFRAEYYSAAADVLKNGRGKATLFKWPIEKFEAAIRAETATAEKWKSGKDAGRKDVAEAVEKWAFGGIDGSVSRTFEKLKYERGSRNWGTFRKFLSKSPKYAKDSAAFQIFQSRMFVAFFLENLFAALPDFVGKKNADKIREILTGGNPSAAPEDFLAEAHEERTKAYEDKIFEIIGDSGGVDETVRKIESLDKDCPATETVKMFCRLTNFNLRIRSEEALVEKALGACRDNCHFLSTFGHYCGTNLDGILWSN